MKRRYFSAGLVGGVAVAGSGIANAVLSESGKAVPIQQSVFHARIDERVMLRAVGAGDRIAARVAAVESAGKAGQFYVRFAAQNSAEFTEDLYLLQMPDGSEMLLHMTPSASDSHTLEAVINHTAA